MLSRSFARLSKIVSHLRYTAKGGRTKKNNKVRSVHSSVTTPVDTSSVFNSRCKFRNSRLVSTNLHQNVKRSVSSSTSQSRRNRQFSRKQLLDSSCSSTDPMLLIRAAVATACAAAVIMSHRIDEHAAFAKTDDSKLSNRDFPNNKHKHRASVNVDEDEDDDAFIDLTKLQVWDRDWDGRRKLRPRPTAKRTIVLVRHGQYNCQHKKDADRRLTDLGHQQAKKLAQR